MPSKNVVKAIFTPTGGIIRIFNADNAEYGDKYVLDIHATLYDHGKVCYLEGLLGKISHETRTVILKELERIGVKYARWSHTNNHGHEKDVCVDVVTGRLKLE